MIFGFGRSRFRRAIDDYGLNRCSVSGATIWIGLPPNPEYRREPLRAAPDAPESICFVEGPQQAGLIAALVGGPEAKTIEHLMIGTSHDYASSQPVGYDFSAAAAALEGAHLPRLLQLSVGDMELLFNGHAYYGKLGDVTHLFAIAPELRELRLRGQFALRSPVHHHRLEQLTALVDDIGVSGGPLSQETVSNLFLSDFPALTQLELSLEENDREGDYTIPPRFFASDGFPALKAFSMDCLAAEAEAPLKAWKAERELR